MATTVARLEAVLSADTKQFDTAMTQSEGRMESSHKIMVGGAAAIAGGIGFIGAKAVSAAADYERSLNVMQSVSGATGKQMDEMSKLAIKLGNDTKLPGTSAKDAADAMTELSKSGLNVNQTMKAVRSTLVLSAAAGVGNARAAEITSNALNAFGLDASRTTKVVDMLANAANASSLDIEDAADSMKMAGAVYSGVQGPAVGAEHALKELTTATALLGNAGIKGSDAGTSLKQTLLQLTGPSDKSKDAMRALYISATQASVGQDQLTTALTGGAKARGEAIGTLEAANKATLEGGDIAFTAAGKMRSLPEIIDLVTKGTKNMTQEQRAGYITQIFGADASRAVIALMKQGSKGWDEMSDAIGKNGSANDLAAAKMKGLRGAQEALNSTLDTLAITFGIVLLPYVTRATQELNKMVGVLADHKDVTIAVTGVLLTLSAAVLAAWAGMKLYSAATLVVEAAVVAWRGVTVAATAAQWLLNAALDANPIGIVVLALVALGAGLVTAYKHSETFRDIVKGALNAVRDAADNVKDLMVWFRDVGALVFDKVHDAWSSPVGKLTAKLVEFGTPLGLTVEAFKWLRDHGGAIWAKLSNTLEKPLDDIAASFREVAKAVDRVVDAVKWVFDHADDIGKVFAGIGSVLGKIPGVGDAADPNMKLPTFGAVAGLVSADSTINQNLWDELGLAKSMGLVLTSGYRPGAITKHGTPSDHGVFPSKAIDVAGPPGTMAAFFTRLIGNKGVKQAFYDPLGSIFGGVLSSYREGGHSDHVHVATYDQGGYLKPGWNLAYNGLGRPEPVGAGNTYINVQVPGLIGSDDALARKIADVLTVHQRRGGQLGFT